MFNKGNIKLRHAELTPELKAKDAVIESMERAIRHYVNKIHRCDTSQIDELNDKIADLSFKNKELQSRLDKIDLDKENSIERIRHDAAIAQLQSEIEIKDFEIQLLKDIATNIVSTTTPHVSMIKELILAIQGQTIKEGE